MGCHKPGVFGDTSHTQALSSEAEGMELISVGLLVPKVNTHLPAELGTCPSCSGVLAVGMIQGLCPQ